jgi:DNA-binding response OmpR family regulator
LALWEGKEGVAKRILAVDDDPQVREMVRDYLTDNEFEVATASNGSEMQRVLDTQAIDLVILDVKMPGQDGFDLARKIRSRSPLPIIMLTAQDEEVDRVLGLELGADDYLTKPFSPRELLARIRAVLRRQELATQAAAGTAPGAKGDTPTYRFEGWELHTPTRRLMSPKKVRVELTPGEYSLLLAFLRSPRRILSRDNLIDAGKSRTESFDRSIDVLILRLRRKIEENPNEPRLIRTERSAGYLFDADVVVGR